MTWSESKRSGRLPAPPPSPSCWSHLVSDAAASNTLFVLEAVASLVEKEEEEEEEEEVRLRSLFLFFNILSLFLALANEETTEDDNQESS